VAAFEDEWLLMQHGYTSAGAGVRARRLGARLLAAVGLRRKPAAALRIEPEGR